MLTISGLRFSGPDKVREGAVRFLDPACVPDEVSILQMARVVAKWLRDHPERLHEQEGILVREALESGFPVNQQILRETANQHSPRMTPKTLYLRNDGEVSPSS
jgi:hypothetical protein